MITTLAWRQDIAHKDADLTVNHEPQERVHVLNAQLMGPDVLYTFLMIAEYNGDRGDDGNGS